MNLPATLALLLCVVPFAAPAQTIYLCGGNEYTRIPCPDGRPIDALDTRSYAQRAEARRILAEEERRAKEMERDPRVVLMGEDGHRFIQDRLKAGDHSGIPRIPGQTILDSVENLRVR